MIGHEGDGTRIRARLFDADGHDEDTGLRPDMVGRLGRQRLLWIDVDGREPAQLAKVGQAVGLGDRLLARLATAPERADLTHFPDHLHVAMQAVDEARSGDPDPGSRPNGLDIIGGRDWVVTIHDGPSAALQRIEAANEGETLLGALDAATFVAAVADEVLAGYLGYVEELERQIDVLDEHALHGRHDDDVLVAIVRLRRRMGDVRRTLAPHRAVFTGLARPEIELHPGFGGPWPGVADRLERTLDAVANVRELLLGTFDIYMGRTAHDANEVVKILTLISAVLLPSVVLAGIMGMNFRLPFFEEPDNVWLVIGAMAILAVGILGAARWRRWI